MLSPSAHVARLEHLSLPTVRSSPSVPPYAIGHLGVAAAVSAMRSVLVMILKSSAASLAQQPAPSVAAHQRGEPGHEGRGGGVKLAIDAVVIFVFSVGAGFRPDNLLDLDPPGRLGSS